MAVWRRRMVPGRDRRRRFPMPTAHTSSVPSSDEPLFLTGATGFLGGYLMAELLARGRRVVVLGRSRDGVALEARLGRLLRWFGIADRAGLLTAVEVDFAQPRCGLGAEAIARLGMGGTIVHCAADTSFAESRRAQVLAANIDGLCNLLELAEARSTSIFHHVSTAYAVGGLHEPVPELPVEAAGFANAYEESKARAERLVAERCGRSGMAYTILRPAIVYGDSRTGRALGFNALYKIVHALWYVSGVARRDLAGAASGGRDAGARIEPDGTLHLPLRMPVAQEGLINLVPVDYFVAATLAVLAAPVPGRIYNVASARPVAMGELVAFTQRYLRLSGLGLACADTVAAPRTRYESLLARLVGPYRAYLGDRRRFATANTLAATGGLEPPVLDYAIFERCIRFAEQAGWGEREVIGAESATAATGV